MYSDLNNYIAISSSSVILGLLVYLHKAHNSYLEILSDQQNKSQKGDNVDLKCNTHFWDNQYEAIRLYELFVGLRKYFWHMNRVN